MCKFEDLNGKTLVNIDGNIGNDSMIFTTTNNEKYELFHYQD